MADSFSYGGQVKDFESRPAKKDLTEVTHEKEYVIHTIDTDDEGMKDFLFTLGCFEGEHITVISSVSDTYVIAVKDARYSIDRELAKAIVVQ